MDPNPKYQTHTRISLVRQFPQRDDDQDELGRLVQAKARSDHMISF